MARLLSNLIIFLGLFIVLITSFFIVQRNNPKRLQFENTPELSGQNENKGILPERIEIAELGISLPVIPASHDGKNWETTQKGVSFLTSSSLPGESGNSIFYGHNWGSILGNLKQAKPGQKIKVSLTNDKFEIFTIKTIQEVSPKNTSILKQTENPKITIYTCSGLFDQKRFVVTAN